MTSKEKIIKFVELKSAHIKKITGINYIEDCDIKDIITWSDKECKRIYEVLIEEIYEFHQKGISEDTCIWCIYHYGICDNCNYGINHGLCHKETSLYSRYFSNKLENSLINAIYRNMIEQIEKYKDNKK